MAQPVAEGRASRKGRRRVPLDELDKRLLNLLQGSFPLAAAPVRSTWPGWPRCPRTRCSRRRKRLLDERIIREITPIFDTRALGYSSMLVAAKVDPENPHARGEGHQRAPGRLAQLPAQPRLQPLVHDRDRARLAARARGHARGAASA